MDQTPRINRTRIALAMTALLACTPAAFAGDSYGYGYSDAAQKATARIAEKVESAMKTMEKGREQYKNGQYEEALQSFTSARNDLPNAPQLADRRAYATQLVTTASVAVAQVYRKNGRYLEAEEKLRSALEMDPNNRAVKQELEYLKDPVRTNPALTPQHVENIKIVNRTMEKAYGFYDLGQFNEAKTEFEKVLRIDPYNVAARRGLERVIQGGISPYNRAAYDHTRAEMLRQVAAAWETPVPMEAPTMSAITPGSNTQGGDAAIKNKLQQIILPEVNFENTTLEEAIDFLRQRSRALDTSNSGEKGINFIIQNAAGGSLAGGLGDAPTGELFGDEEGGDTAPVASGGAAPGTKIISELKLRNVPLLKVLNVITEAVGMRYKVDDFSVIILPAGSEGTITQRSFIVPPNFYSALAAAAGGNSGGGGELDPFSPDSGGSSITPREPIDALLRKLGIQFPQGASASFLPSSSRLIVNNTQNNLDLIEQFVNTIVDQAPRMVKITTKFVEVSQDNTEELGFDWVVSPFQVGNGTRYVGGGTNGNGTPGRYPTDFVGAPSGADSWVDGITGSNNDPVRNLITSANRTGTGAINGDSINSLLNNPNRTQQADTAAPGIMSFTGIFNKGTMQVIMRGLSQRKGTDVLTAPSITAKSGEEATIEVIREFIYPTDYTEPQLPSSVGSSYNDRNNNNNDGSGSSSPAQISTFPVTPSTPQQFQTRSVGVTLKIKPNIGEENSHLIDFEFAPEIVEFDGFINYGSPISTAGIDADGNPTTVTITENRIEMPVFSTRRVQTSLYVYDGHTVSIGGLMQESVQLVEDKVPILGDLPLVGRLFRSEASNHVKSNLIIFVTGDIIDPTGRSVRANTAEPELSSTADEGLLPEG